MGLTFDEWNDLPSNKKADAYILLNNHDKFKARMQGPDPIIEEREQQKKDTEEK